MTMLLNEEQTILKNSAHTFFNERMPIKALRDLRDTHDATGYDPELWREMADMGWAGVLIPEEYGGVEFGYQGLGQILEESGRTLAASPLLSTALLAAPLIRAAGTTAQKNDILTALASGQRIIALALDEAPRHAPTAIRTSAEPRDGGWMLNGSKTFVLDGHVADQIIVLARTAGESKDPKGLTLFILDSQATGITCNRTLMVDTRNAANITFSNVQVTADAVLGEVDAGFKVLEPALDGARIGLAAEMLGNGLEAFERTIAHLKMREQFGVPIGSFQALKHRAALMYCELELTKSVVLEGLNALDEGRDDVAELASLAKAKACDMLELISNEAVQMHGGIGMTDEEDIGWFLKRARVAQQIFGDAQFHRDRYATLRGF